MRCALRASGERRATTGSGDEELVALMNGEILVGSFSSRNERRTSA